MSSSSPQSSIGSNISSSRSASPDAAAGKSLKKITTFPRSFSRSDSDEKEPSRNGTYKSPTLHHKTTSSSLSNSHRSDTSGSGRDRERMMSNNNGGIIADDGVLTMMEESASGISRSMYSGSSTPVSHQSRKKATSMVGSGSVVGGGRHLRVDSCDFDDNLSVGTDATDRQAGSGNNNGSRHNAKLHNQEMVDVSVDQEYGEFGETDPYSYKARKTLWGSSVNTRDGILRDHGLAVFTTRRQKVRYYSIFACMMISLVVIIGVSVTITQPKTEEDNGEDNRPPLIPPTTTTEATDEDAGDQIGVLVTDATEVASSNEVDTSTPTVNTPTTDTTPTTPTDTTPTTSTTAPHDMCDYGDLDDENTPVPIPQLQCFCDGYISQWTDNQLEKYQKLKDEWLTSFYGDKEFEFSPDSCHAHNVALAWLASDDEATNYDSPDFFLSAKDRFALSIIFQEWKGYEWKSTTSSESSSSWLDSSSFCDWYGITCDESARHKVTEIRLVENNVQGTIPTELKWLNSLVILDIAQNHLKGSIPTEIYDMSLQVISLSVNKLTGTLSSNIEQLSNLVELKLDLNLLTGTIPTELGILSSLEVLELWDNEFYGTFDTQHFGISLRDLLIHNNNGITGTLSSQWALNSPNLMNLDIGKTGMGGTTIPTEFGLWTDLKRLNLQDLKSTLEGTIPSQVTSLPNLQTLVLSENQLSGNLPTNGEYYGSNLRFIILDHNKIEGTIPTQLGTLENLQTLELHNNELRGEIPTELAKLTSSLTNINLSGNAELKGPVPQSICELRNGPLKSFVTSCDMECDIPACCTQCA